MGQVSQTIPHLLDGVSQQPDVLRRSSQGDDQVNALDSVALGKIKRPPTEHIAKLVANPAGYDLAYIHNVNRDSSERYRMIFINSDVKVFDALLNTEYTVTAPSGKTYLGTTNPSRDIRCVTIGDYTFVLNRSKTVRRNTTKRSASRPKEALISVRQSDYSTEFVVYINGVAYIYMSPDGMTAGARVGISTDTIADKLHKLLVAHSALSPFTFELVGSTIYMSRSDGQDFTVRTEDGLGDTALLAIKGSIQRQEDLPARAKNGFVVEVTGDDRSKFDNFYLVYDDNGMPEKAGVWRETLKAEEFIAFDITTMPHQLLRKYVSTVDLIAKGTPIQPLVQQGNTGAAAITPTGWFTPLGGTPSMSFAPSGNAQAASSAFYYQNLPEAAGGSYTAKVCFDYSVSFFGISVKLNAELVDSAGTPIANTKTTRTLTAMTSGTNEFIELPVPVTIPLGAKVRVYWEGGSGSAYANTNITLHPQNHETTAFKGVIVTAAASPATATVTLPATEIYPDASLVRIVLDGTNYDHTSNSDARTGAEVITSLQTLFLTPYTATVLSPGVLQIRHNSGTPITVTASCTYPETSRAFFQGQTVTLPGSTANYKLENMTDGSWSPVFFSASVTGSRVQFGSLSQGVLNKAKKDDKCRIVAVSGTVPNDPITEFFFEPVTWREREVGNLKLAPFPSFTDRKLNDVFYVGGRLGLLADENVVMSEAADLFNFFRTTVTQLLPTDVIDVRQASAKIANFHSAVEWNKKLYLFSDHGQYVLAGEPVLSPTTARLDPVGSFENSVRLRPLVVGDRLFAARKKGASTQVMEFHLVEEEKIDADDVTRHVPSFLLGEPVQMAGDGVLNLLLVLTTGNSQKSLYPRTFQYEGRELSQSSWSRWDFPLGSVIIGVEIIDSKLAIVSKRSDGVFLDVMDLDVEHE